MKKNLALLVLWVYIFWLTIPSYAFTDSDVEAKATELKWLITQIFSDKKNYDKYSKVFKEIFEWCAKTCKNELNKQASAKIIETYDVDFLWTEPIEKKEEKKSEDDNKPHWVIRQYWLQEVIDWDTIRIYDNSWDYKVRLIWIDAPESNDTRFWYAECYWEESTKHLKELIWENKLIQIEFDDSQWLYDKYDRMLWYLVIDWENLNEKMIKDWYAYEYTYNKKYKYSDKFERAEKDAKNDKLGVWWENACLWLRWDKTETAKKVKEYKEEKEKQEREASRSSYYSYPSSSSYSSSSSSYSSYWQWSSYSSSSSYRPSECELHTWYRGERWWCYYINSKWNKSYNSSCC